MKKTTLIIIASLIVIAVMLLLNFRRGQRAPEMETATVVRGNISISIFASGELKSARQADVFAQTTGTVASLPVADGQTVYQGQVLLQLDSTAAQSSVAQNELALKAALQKKKNLEDSVYSATDLQAAEALANEKRTAWVRAEEDYNEDKGDENRQAARNAAYTTYLQAEENLENLKNSNPTAADWAAVEAEIESAQRALAEAQLNLSRTTIVAPQTGTLIFTDSSDGKVSSTSVISAGQKISTVADFSQTIFVAEVDESEIGEVAVGQKVKVKLETHAGKEFEGQVAAIARTTTLDSSGNKIVEVEIDLESEGLERLYLHLSGDAEIILEEKRNVLLVPTEAVSTENGKDFVYVVKENGVIKREVKLGLENDDLVEVVTGVSEGEEVNVNPNQKLD